MREVYLFTKANNKVSNCWLKVCVLNSLTNLLHELKLSSTINHSFKVGVLTHNMRIIVGSPTTSLPPASWRSCWGWSTWRRCSPAWWCPWSVSSWAGSAPVTSCYLLQFDMSNDRIDLCFYQYYDKQDFNTSEEICGWVFYFSWL